MCTWTKAMKEKRKREKGVAASVADAACWAECRNDYYDFWIWDGIFCLPLPPIADYRYYYHFFYFYFNEKNPFQFYLWLPGGKTPVRVNQLNRSVCFSYFSLHFSTGFSYFIIQCCLAAYYYIFTISSSHISYLLGSSQYRITHNSLIAAFIYLE